MYVVAQLEVMADTQMIIVVSVKERQTIMSNEEWRNQSDEWHKGWRCCQDAVDIPEHYSEEFEAGYRYALEHPFGPCAIPQ